MSLELPLQVAYRISILSEDEYFVVRMLRRKKPDEGIEFCIFVNMPSTARLNYLEQAVSPSSRSNRSGPIPKLLSSGRKSLN